MKLKDVDAIDLARLVYPEAYIRVGADLVGLGNRILGRFLNGTSTAQENISVIKKFLHSRGYATS